MLRAQQEHGVHTVVPAARLTTTNNMDRTGILSYIKLPQKDFAEYWEKIIVPEEVKSRLLSQAILEFTLRGKVSDTSVPLHGLILLVGPPGTGKTSLARGLANITAISLSEGFHFIEVEPHALASAALGRSQQAVRDLLQKTVAEYAAHGPLIVLLDEVETLAADRRRLSLEANPVDVHRATDAVLASLDHLAAQHPQLLFIATTNFPEAVDAALVSRADLVEIIAKPDKSAVRAILSDTLSALADRWPKVVQVMRHRQFETAVNDCVGLDGRQIRKAAVTACAASKDLALDPNLLTIEDLLRSIRHTKKRKP
jgi:SpoVK/Ycf46/Vps4 family AAA+-type ATPase